MRLRPALAALSATALLGLAACGGSSDDDSAAATSGAATQGSAAQESSAGSESGSGDASSFCAEGLGVLDQFEGQLESAGADGLATVLPQIVAALDTLDPPADIASDFQTLRDGYDQLAQAATTNDLTTEDGQAAFQAVYGAVGATAQPAEDAVNAWTDANCGDEG